MAVTRELLRYFSTGLIMWINYLIMLKHLSYGNAIPCKLPWILLQWILPHQMLRYYQVISMPVLIPPLVMMREPVYVAISGIITFQYPIT